MSIYVVSHASDNCILINGVRIDVHNERLSGCFGYYLDTKTARILEKMVIGYDNAYKSSFGVPASFTFRTAKRPFRVVSASSWSNASDEKTLIEDLRAIREEILSEGWQWAATAASLSGRVCREYAPTSQLPPRWREIAHNSIHQGPMVCARGGGDNVIAWDREKAFLRALYKHVPTGQWSAIHPDRTMDCRGLSGLIRATVHVDASRYARSIPPLPVRLNGFTCYPTGFVRGSWTLDMFFDAIDNGDYSLVETHEICITKTDKLFAKAADRIAAVKSKRLSKLLYTRLWGRLASTGGFEGYNTMRYPYPKTLLGSRLNWYYMGNSPLSVNCPPDYRPDCAAFIAGDNHLVMNQAIRAYRQGSVIATHVDCIWTDDRTVGPMPSFREKHSGNARFYGIGCYQVGDNFGTQGYNGEVTEEKVKAWGASLNDGDGIYRLWEGSPSNSKEAVSDPPHHSEAYAANPPPRNTENIYWKGWTNKGWIYNED